jgi:hypothetical protein
MWHEFTSQIQDLTASIDLPATLGAGLLFGTLLSSFLFWITAG